MPRNLLLFSLLLILSYCSPKKEIPGFDKTKWHEDADGCNGNRLAQLDLLRNEKSTLKGWSSESIGELLGTPDTRDLDKRHKLYYTYYLSGSSDCISESAKPKIYLQIRFNAINKADELTIFE